MFASTRLSVRNALPVSSAISRANSSTCARITAAHCATIAPRFRDATLAQAFCAASASRTAASTSAASPSAARATSRRVAGFTTANVPPPDAGTTRPPIKCLPDSATASAPWSSVGASGVTEAWFGNGLSNIGFASTL